MNDDNWNRYGAFSFHPKGCGLWSSNLGFYDLVMDFDSAETYFLFLNLCESYGGKYGVDKCWQVWRASFDYPSLDFLRKNVNYAELFA